MSESVRFESSHVAGDYSNGRLTVALGHSDERKGVTTWQQVWFSVPADFHTHPDSVAAALMTLVGNQYRAATFNFSISSYCAAHLRAFYELDEVGPIDESLEPRQRGRWIGLNLSGGCDSAGLWCLLTHGLGVPFKTITTNYAGPWAHEAIGYSRFAIDVLCGTNLRDLRLDQHGRFHAAVPLLYANYLDLRGLASGHTIRHTSTDLQEFRAGQKPAFLAHEAAYHAGGLEELHLVRGLHTLGTLSLLLQYQPDLTQSAARASGAFDRRGKALEKTFMMKWLCAERGWPEPSWIAGVQPPPPARAAKPPRISLRGVFLRKHLGVDLAERLMPGLSRYDFSSIDHLSLKFLSGHQPRYAPLMPADLRAPLLAAYERAGIAPYTAQDEAALVQIEDFIAHANEHLVR